MKKLQAVLVSLCFAFVGISAGRLLFHIISEDLNKVGDFIGLIPILCFIGFLLYIGGSLCLKIVRESFSGQRHLK